ncbi:neurogenic locus notch homolog protein 1-like isoform X2 [Dreissena polymorpha]|uniref:neurogenic locus notch homolog protein 1-like isoform X2 n=1 Tax=Dreissena polymorpha TaxID=45954 RepID=UPI00226424DC|nr:neurogenic locus notch homolog protein 1-like isoform X2 [Dreissena polymorpha]
MFQKVIAGRVNFELEVLQYDNPRDISLRGNDTNGAWKCCDMRSTAPQSTCTTHCPTAFVFCWAGTDDGSCTGPQISTVPLLTNTFAASYNRTFAVQGQWAIGTEDSMTIIIEVRNINLKNTYDVISHFTTKFNGDIAQTYALSKQNIFDTMIDKKTLVSLTIGVRVWCMEGYFGPNCNVQCNGYKTCPHHDEVVNKFSNNEIVLSMINNGTQNHNIRANTIILYDFFAKTVCQNSTDIRLDIQDFSFQPSLDYGTYHIAVRLGANCSHRQVSPLKVVSWLLQHRYHAPDKDLSVSSPVLNLSPSGVLQTTTTVLFRVATMEDIRCGNCSVHIRINFCSGIGHCSSLETPIQLSLENSQLMQSGNSIQEISRSIFAISVIEIPIVLDVTVDYVYQPVFNWQLNRIAVNLSMKAGDDNINSLVLLPDKTPGVRLELDVLGWCGNGQYGKHCEYSCVASYSNENYTCSSSGNTVCMPGFSAAKHGCADTDECSNNSLCQNGATCTNTIGSFYCACQDGWIGSTCSYDINECETAPLVNVISCSNIPGSYKYTCKPGFTGNDCIDINECNDDSENQNMCDGDTCFNTFGSYECKSMLRYGEIEDDPCSIDGVVCGNHGLCTNTSNGYTCRCFRFYTGTHCEITRNPCVDSNTTCANGGTCHFKNNTFLCECPPGLDPYSNCHHDIDECSEANKPKFCVNGACQNTQGSFECTCQKGFEGQSCDHEIDMCAIAHIPCYNRGRCYTVNQIIQCACLPGWDPHDRCRFDIDECFLYSNICGNGKCRNTNGSYVCECNYGWHGQNCNVVSTNCERNPCLHGICKDMIGDYSCVCQYGWKGKNCSEDIDECQADSNPCKHGKCLNLNGGYNCSCDSGWKGPNCTADINECENGSYICDCLNGWKGKNCSEDINECAPNPWQHHGVCNNTQGGYECICWNNWTGVNCSIDVDECERNDVCINGICQNYDGGYNCTCVSGWKGSNCSHDVDECTSMPCLNGGNCSNVDGFFNCSCPQGYKGRVCDRDVDECETDFHICDNNGTCMNTFGSYVCNCSKGWIGNSCENDVNECLTEPCKNGGVCFNTNGSFYCQCFVETGFAGRLCENDVNECLTSPCLHNAICKNYDGGFNCSCPSGWTGERCDVNIDECQQPQCTNGGTCNDCDGGFLCNCPLAWKGDRCEFDVNECEQSVVCENNGTCHNTIGSFSCECSRYFAGKTCSNYIDQCNTVTCYNDGTCEESHLDFKCLCHKWWTGKVCETDIDECLSSPCSNNGTCQNYNGNFSCSCTSGWTGNLCDVDIKECKQCANGGTCEFAGGGFRCHCPSAWTGNTCDVDVDECEHKNICENGATCINLPGSFSCVCTQSFTGSRCTTYVDQCSYVTCYNDGTCIETISGAKCQCHKSWTGISCEKDVDECLQKGTCNSDTFCENTNGSYKCLPLLSTTTTRLPLTEIQTTTSSTTRKTSMQNDTTSEAFNSTLDPSRTKSSSTTTTPVNYITLTTKSFKSSLTPTLPDSTTENKPDTSVKQETQPPFSNSSSMAAQSKTTQAHSRFTLTPTLSTLLMNATKQALSQSSESPIETTTILHPNTTNITNSLTSKASPAEVLTTNIAKSSNQYSSSTTISPLDSSSKALPVTHTAHRAPTTSYLSSNTLSPKSTTLNIQQGKSNSQTEKKKDSNGYVPIIGAVVGVVLLIVIVVVSYRCYRSRQLNRNDQTQGLDDNIQMGANVNTAEESNRNTIKFVENPAYDTFSDGTKV